MNADSKKHMQYFWHELAKNANVTIGDLYYAPHIDALQAPICKDGRTAHMSVSALELMQNSRVSQLCDLATMRFEKALAELNEGKDEPASIVINTPVPEPDNDRLWQSIVAIGRSA